jgi:hypothetical protein
MHATEISMKHGKKLPRPTEANAQAGATKPAAEDL